MTEVSSIGASSPALTGSRTSLADNFEMFLTLLTEQMKNQDPLEPLDSTQFVNQLVDFSSVEQQIAQNQNLESLLLIQSAAAQGSSVGYIGRLATAETTQAPLSNGKASWDYILPNDAESVELSILDADGRVVARATGDTTTGSHTFDWDGTDSVGAQLDDGVYSLEVTALDEEGEPVFADIRATAEVTGVDLSGAEVIVEMGPIRAPLSSILSLRANEPEAAPAV